MFNGMWVGLNVMWVVSKCSMGFSCGCVDLGRAYLLVQRRILFLKWPSWIDMLKVERTM